MRCALLLILLLLLPMQSAHAAIRAVLIGIVTYDALPGKPMPGSLHDVIQVKRTLKLAGATDETVTALVDAKATSASIQASLARLSAEAQAGDTVVFYFSGRGSLADTADPDGRHAPTLAPVDAALDRSEKDLPLDALAEWTKGIAGRGAAPVVLVDASFYAPVGRGEFEVRVHNPEPRTLRRGDLKPRRDLWHGTGQFLCAADYNGNAYEYKVTGDQWAGVFTNEVMQRIAGAVAAKQPLPTPTQILERIDSAFQGKTEETGYDHFLPYHPASPDAASALPLFAGAKSDSPPTAPPYTEPLATDPVTFDFRVAVCVFAPMTSASVAKSVVEEVRNQLHALLPDVTFPTNNGGCDRIVSIFLPGAGTKPRAGWSITVTGSELEQSFDKVEGNFPTRKAAVVWAKQEVAPYLRLQARIKQLWKYADTAESLPRPRIERGEGKTGALVTGEQYTVAVTVPEMRGTLYVLERHGDGAVQIDYPQFVAKSRRWLDNNLANQSQPPSFRYKVTAEQPAGIATVRVIYLPASPDLPALVASAEVQTIEKRAWQAKVTAQITAVLQKSVNRKPLSSSVTYERAPETPANIAQEPK